MRRGGLGYGPLSMPECEEHFPAALESTMQTYYNISATDLLDKVMQLKILNSLHRSIFELFPSSTMPKKMLKSGRGGIRKMTPCVRSYLERTKATHFLFHSPIRSAEHLMIMKMRKFMDVPGSQRDGSKEQPASSQTVKETSIGIVRPADDAGARGKIRRSIAP